MEQFDRDRMMDARELLEIAEQALDFAWRPTGPSSWLSN
jgi:hypothetical protein